MKKMLLLLTCAVGIATAQAQTSPAATGNAYGRRAQAAGREPRTPEQRAELQTRQLTKQLSLSAEQQAQVQPIFLAQAQNVDKLRGQAGANRGTMREQLQASRTRTDEQLKAVLTPAQFAQYQQMRDERRENLQETRQAKTRGRRGLQPAG